MTRHTNIIDNVHGFVLCCYMRSAEQPHHDEKMQITEQEFSKICDNAEDAIKLATWSRILLQDELKNDCYFNNSVWLNQFCLWCAVAIWQDIAFSESPKQPLVTVEALKEYATDTLTINADTVERLIDASRNYWYDFYSYDEFDF